MQPLNVFIVDDEFQSRNLLRVLLIENFQNINITGEASNVSITDHTYDFKGWNARTFNTLFDASREAGISRLYGGIHYRRSIEIGLELGEEMGTAIGDLNLRN